MALTTLRPEAEVVVPLLEEMLTYMNADGTFQVSLVVSGKYRQCLPEEANKKRDPY